MQVGTGRKICFPCAHLHFLRKLPLFLRKMLPAGVFAVVEEAVAVVDIAVFQHLAEGGGALRAAAHTSLRLRAGQRILPISPVFSGAGLGGRVGAVLPAPLPLSCGAFWLWLVSGRPGLPPLFRSSSLPQAVSASTMASTRKIAESCFMMKKFSFPGCARCAAVSICLRRPS